MSPNRRVYDVNKAQGECLDHDRLPTSAEQDGGYCAVQVRTGRSFVSTLPRANQTIDRRVRELGVDPETLHLAPRWERAWTGSGLLHVVPFFKDGADP